MGYRMTTHDENGNVLNCSKLFGYLTDEELQKSRALKWLIEHHKLDDYEPEERTESWIWDYEAYHEMTLTRLEFLEFIELYILDRNEFWYKDSPEYRDSIVSYEHELSMDHVKIGWY